MQNFRVKCLHLPARTTLKAFLSNPQVASGQRGVEWRVFSFGAAFDTLRFGAEPTLQGITLDPPQFSSLLARYGSERRKPTHGRPGGLGGYSAEFLSKIADAVPQSATNASASHRILPLVVARSAVPSVALLPMARCSGQCGGKGWCEGDASRDGAGRATCGCFVPFGLDRLGSGGPQCEDTSAWRSDLQPNAHWGPYCFANCSGRGACDWHGFCRCQPGYYGIDCALTRSADGTVTVDVPLLEPRASATERVDGPPRPLTPIAKLLGGGAELRTGTGGKTAGAAGGGGGGGRGKNLFYVVDTPPLLRFGVDFAAGNEYMITERMLRSVHRAPTADAAANLWYTGAPLVIDGHRLLARLWHVATAWLGASESLRELDEPPRAGAPRRPLVLMPLLTERASMDSFQLSYSHDDREEWPALAAAPHVRGILGRSAGCGLYPPPSRAGTSASSDAERAALVGDSSGGASVDVAMGRLADLLTRRRRAAGAATLHGLFGDGGFTSFHTSPARSGCELPPSVLPASAHRIWAGLQFSGNPRNPVFFQRGRDVVLPQMLLLRGVGSHADQPSCEQMQATSPYSPRFARRHLHAARSTLLWFGGHPGHGNARTRMLRTHARTPGFALLDTLHTKERRDPVNMSLSSAFCWVPRGQGDGDPTRHMLSIFHGCVPVFTLGDTASTESDALPFEEVLPWERFSLRVPQASLATLPAKLRAAARAPTLRAMQAELGCAWRALFWTSLMGSCFGESARGDAFDTLMLVLRRRAAAWPATVRPPASASACSVGVAQHRASRPLPQHLLDQTGGQLRADLAPGTTANIA